MAHAPFISAGLVTDLVEELRLRRWARENYVPVDFRDQAWHAVVLEEMHRRDQELLVANDYDGVAQRIVPLVPAHGPVLRGPHHGITRPHVLARIPYVE